MRRRVLIVDDHAGFRSWARTLLELRGYSVVGEAPDGASALASAGVLRLEVVLLDIRLPDIDGFEVTRRLARTGSDAVVVLVSSRDAADYGGLITDSPARG